MGRKTWLITGDESGAEFLREQVVLGDREVQGMLERLACTTLTPSEVLWTNLEVRTAPGIGYWITAGGRYFTARRYRA